MGKLLRNDTAMINVPVLKTNSICLFEKAYIKEPIIIIDHIAKTGEDFKKLNIFFVIIFTQNNTNAMIDNYIPHPLSLLVAPTPASALY
jgi:hypothetical protein